MSDIWHGLLVRRYSESTRRTHARLQPSLADIVLDVYRDDSRVLYTLLVLFPVCIAL